MTIEIQMLKFQDYSISSFGLWALEFNQWAWASGRLCTGCGDTSCRCWLFFPFPLP